MYIVLKRQAFQLCKVLMEVVVCVCCYMHVYAIFVFANVLKAYL